MDSATIITIASLALVLVVTGMIAFLLSSSKSKQKNRMMSVIRAALIYSGKAMGLDARREALARKLKERSEPEGEEKRKTLAVSLMQANIDISVKKFWFFSMLFSGGPGRCLLSFGV